MEPNYGYKHTKGFLVFILIVIIMAIGAVYAQTSPNTPSGYSIDSQTGNLLPNNGITSATGWTITTGSPTWTPVSPGGVFDTDGYTYSYGRESLGQAGISLGSFNHGYLNSGAVFVTGFSYGLTYRFPCANSFGTNCDGTSQTAAPANPVQDNLRVEVGYYPATGNPTFYTHQLGLKNINDGNPAYNPNWQTLAQTVTFAGAKPLSQAGSVNFEIIGNDAGNWACLNGSCYGPQVKNAYVRANYSVDPCILNPAFNTNCPGFNNVIQGVQSPVYWYSYNIAQRMPHIGGGVQLHGFEYGFNWSNYGACYNSFLFWCTDWRTDGGATVNFTVTNKNNVTLYSDSQYRGGNNQSGSYYNRFLFTETQNSLDMGNVNWSLSGVWNHLAVAGWTRPIWTPDPCYFNGLYSPSCTNFKETLTKTLEDIKAQQERLSATNSTTNAVSVASVNTSTPIAAAPAPATSTNTSVTEEPVRTSNTQFALSLIRSNDRREQTIAIQASQTARSEAAARAESSRSEAVAIADANQQQGAAASDAAAEAAQASGTITVPGRVATQSAQMSLGSPSVSAASINAGAMLPLPGATRQTATVPETIMPTEPANTGSILAVKMPEPQPSPVQQVTTAVSVAPPYQAPQAMDTVQLPKQELMAVTAPQVDLAMVDNRPPVTAMFRPTTPAVDTASLPPAVPLTETPAVIQTTPVAIVETRTIETDSATSPTNFVTNRTNPITSIVEGRAPVVDSGTPKTELAAVNKTVAPNELAAGMDIDRIAITPQGFNVYASLVLRDAAFYAPREIYRGQRTVDNVRALRSLGQDARHQEMVDQQYRR